MLDQLNTIYVLLATLRVQVESRNCAYEMIQWEFKKAGFRNIVKCHTMGLEMRSFWPFFCLYHVFILPYIFYFQALFQQMYGTKGEKSKAFCIKITTAVNCECIPNSFPFTRQSGKHFHSVIVKLGQRGKKCSSESQRLGSFEFAQEMV